MWGLLTILPCLLCTDAQASALPSLVQTTQVSDPYAVAIEAQQHYDAGMEAIVSDGERAHALFVKSAELYQLLVDIPLANGELNYNLGNAWIQAGNPGKAIAALLDAQMLLPGDARVATSLDHARALVEPESATPHSAAPLDRAAAWWSWLSPSARGFTAAGMWAALWLLVTWGVWTRWSARLPWRTVIGVVAFASAVVTGTCLTDVIRTTLHPPGVITSDTTVARKGNGEGFAPAFSEPLKRGMEFTLIEGRPQWVHVRLRDGQAAWVRSSDAHVAGDWRTDRPANSL